MDKWEFIFAYNSVEVVEPFANLLRGTAVEPFANLLRDTAVERFANLLRDTAELASRFSRTDFWTTEMGIGQGGSGHPYVPASLCSPNYIHGQNSFC